MVTIKEIAELTGVSPTTVQNVIHGRTNKVSKENLERIRSTDRSSVSLRVRSAGQATT